VKLVHLFGFIAQKFTTKHDHMNVKRNNRLQVTSGGKAFL